MIYDKPPITIDEQIAKLTTVAPLGTQPKKVVESQWVGLLQNLVRILWNECALLWITLWKSIVKPKELATFTLTVPVLLPVRSACGSFFVHSAHNKCTSHVYLRSTLEAFFLFSLLCYV